MSEKKKEPKRNLGKDAKDIMTKFNALADAKYKQSMTTRLLVLFCSIVIVVAFFFSYRLQAEAMNKIIVVDSAGEMKKIKAESEDNVYKALLYTHCEQAGYYANSFDQLSMQENQRKAKYLIAQDDLERVFATYNSQKAYHDCINRGVVYKYTFKDIITAKNVGGNEYRVQFYGILEIKDAGSVRAVRVISDGVASRVEPRWPNNVTGYKLRNYTQTYEEESLEYTPVSDAYAPAGTVPSSSLQTAE